MKKILTLITLLVAIVTGVKATDFVDTYGALGTVTGSYIANGISKIALGTNAKANNGIQANTSGTDLEFTVSTPTGFTIKTVKFKGDSNTTTVTTNDASGSVSGPTSNVYTYTASASKTSVVFTVGSASGKATKLTEFEVTVSSTITDDYEYITPTSISDGVIAYTSSLGDDKLVTAMAGVNGPSVSSSNITFGNGKGYSLTTSRPIKAVYSVWFQRGPSADAKWVGYNTGTVSEMTTTTEIGTYTLSTNEWVASDEETTFVAFKTSDGSNHSIAGIHIFYYDSSIPSISASSVAITEDATDAGEFAFTVDKKETTGTVTASTEADWLTLGAVDNVNGKVPFIATANTGSVSRSATVTLTYTYNTSETVTKDVTVTQSANVKGTAIIRVTLGGSTSATVTGTIGGTADVSVQSDKKFGSNSYAGFTLADGNTFRAGDIINVNIPEDGAATSSGFIGIYDTDKSTVLYNTGTKGVVGDNKFVLPAAVNGKTTLYICRTSTNSWNAYVDYIEVTRPNVAAALSNTDDKDFGFATFCSSSNFTISGGTAYKAELSGNAIVLKELTGIIPANEGVVIAGNKNATVAIEYTANDATAVTTGNILKGTTARVTTASLKSDASDKILGFFKSSSTFKQYTGEYFPAGLAYIRLNSGNTPNSLEMRFEEATSVKNIEAVSFKNETKVGKKAFVNGQLVIITENGYVNALGQTVK